MKLLDGHPEVVFANLDSFVIEGADVRVRVIESGGNLMFNVDPKGSNWITQLAVAEMMHHSSQARLTVRGASIINKTDDLMTTIHVQLANVRDRLAHGRYADPVGDVEQELTKLAISLRGLQDTGK